MIDRNGSRTIYREFWRVRANEIPERVLDLSLCRGAQRFEPPFQHPIYLLFSDFYVYVNEPGRGRLSALPLWAMVVDFAKQDPDAAFPIASRSPEIRAANEGLNDGQTLDTLVWGPAAFLWPFEPIPGLEVTARKPSWWRQIWDAPALHSVRPGERRLARIAMVIGILAGLVTVGVVGYYTITLLLEPG
jgi:hypothetical protein